MEQICILYMLPMTDCFDMALKYLFILHVHQQRCIVLWINLIIESGVWKIRHRHKSVTYRRTDRWTDRYTTLTCIYLIIVAVSIKKCSKCSIIISVALLLFIFMVHTNPAKKGCACNAACYMHACVHVILIILIWINRNRLVWAID